MAAIQFDSRVFFICVLAVVFLKSNYRQNAASAQSTRYYTFHVHYKSFTRLCSTKEIAVVNGKLPGPTIYAREGDSMSIKVINELPDKNVTIHWHGIRQLRSGWADGPGYVTQCPMKPGSSYTYNFNVTGQRGTLWWHGHLAWSRATVHGAIVIFPKKGSSYPFVAPSHEIPLVFGEWWKMTMDAVASQTTQSGGALPLSDAYTINGQPGSLHPCSANGTTRILLEKGKTYLLRMVNAALGGQLFVGVGGHKLTVVEVDATYVKPVEVDHFLLQPGQTSSVLLKAGQTQGNFYLAARPFIAPNVSTDNTTATAIITYVTASGDPVSSSSSAPLMPSLPAFNDTSDAARFSQSLRSLASPEFPVNVPLQVDRHLFFTVGLGLLPCSSCPFNVTLAAAVNNISFVLPQTALLQAHYFNQSNVFTEDFPTAPQNMIDFTGQPPANPFTVRGTRVTKIPFNSTVQLVLQGTSLIGKENHPIHLHGFNFYVVGQGFGNYNNVTDPPSFNLVDPQERNTIGIPQGGWAAIRFRADNPGVWFMHCHLELHTMLGLDTAIVVDDGSTLDQSLIPPPLDLPPC